MDDVDLLKMQIAQAKEQLKRVQAQRAYKAAQPQFNPQSINAPKVEPNIDYTQSLISRKLAAQEVLRHLKPARWTSIASVAGFFFIALAELTHKYWGAILAFIFSVAMIIYLYRVQNEYRRLEQFYMSQ